MLLVNFDIIDGCNWSRESGINKKFKDQSELDLYIDRLWSGMYEVKINSIKEIEE